MKDPEFIELRNKFFISLFILIIFAIPTFLILKNKVFIGDSTILKSLKNNDSMLILIVEDKCNRCNEAKKVLNKTEINYFILNKSRVRDYDSIIDKLKIQKDLQVPVLIYAKEGQLYSYIYDIKTKSEIISFVESIKEDGGN